MTRELKLALIVGFALVLVVTVLISDHLSRARQAELAGNIPADPIKVVEPQTIITDTTQYVAGVGTTAEVSAPALPGPSNPTTVAVTPTPTTEPVTIYQGGRGDEYSQQAGIGRAVAEQHGEIKDGMIFLPPPPAIRTTVDPLPTQPPINSLNQVPTPVPTTPDRLYTVIDGDSAFKICKNTYGDGKVWRKLIKYNKLDEDGQLKVGMQIKLPSAEVLLGKKPTALAAGSTSPLPFAQQVPANKSQVAGMRPSPLAGNVPTNSMTPMTAKTHSYTVRKGDTLADIAKHQLGTSKRAHEIVELNRRTIKDPDNVPLGAVLTLPAA